MKNLLPKNSDGCPFLLLAPMEGIGDRAFRRAMATIGGFDEACTEFLRVPLNGHIPSLAKQFDPTVTHPIPQAVQIMGSECGLMAEMAYELEKRGAHRIDLNCGCPSNTVTGKGAGSSLLRNPNDLFEVAKAIVNAVTIPVSIKMRSGFNDTSLFIENLLAAQASGACFVTLHPRTKIEGYRPPADWSLIARAKELLTIPLVGNGDILNVESALKMLEQTKCDALMVGRGAVINPFIFHEIKAHFARKTFEPNWERFEIFIETFMNEMTKEMTTKGHVNKLKQLLGFLFQKNEHLQALRLEVLRFNFEDPREFLIAVLPHYQKAWNLK